MRRIPAQALNIMLLAVPLAGGAGTVFSQEYDCYTLHLTNNAANSIDPIHLSSSDDRGWDHDLHGNGIRTFSGSIDVLNIVHGAYGLELVDKDGDAVVEMKVQFFQRKTENITSNWLLGCEFHNPER